jgi:hypothetical protein
MQWPRMIFSSADVLLRELKDDMLSNAVICMLNLPTYDQ